MKGIILAGGTGSRLYPMTLAVNKQLLPIYNKPLIYYPLSLLIDSGLNDILLISTPAALPNFAKLLGDGSHLGIKLRYAAQAHPDGIAQALLIARDFLAGDSACLILGDNIFMALSAVNKVRQASHNLSGALIFACQVQDPARYGVLAFDGAGQVTDIIEKPKLPPSPWAVTGLYCYDASAVERAAQLRPSARGELEITDLNLSYLHSHNLQVHCLPRGSAWLDAGTPGSLLDAADYIRVLETRQGQLYGSPELSAYQQGFIKRTQLLTLGQAQSGTAYGQMLVEIAQERG